MFEGIGKLGSYLQQHTLQVKVNYKLQTGQDLETDKKKDDNIVDIMLSHTSDSDDSSERVASIKQKLMNGREISDEELRYLEKNSPDLYEKAVKVKEVRERLKDDLKHAKTKAEAQQAVTRAQIEVAASAKAELSGAGGIGTASGGGMAGGMAAAGSGTVSAAEAAGVSAAAGNAVSASAGAAMTAPDLAAAPAAESAAAVSAAAAAPVEAAADAASAAGVQAETSTAVATAAGDTQTSKNTAVYEKYIMQVRAIQDEWQKFSRSKEYQQMPAGEKTEK